MAVTGTNIIPIAAVAPINPATAPCSSGFTTSDAPAAVPVLIRPKPKPEITILATSKIFDIGNKNIQNGITRRTAPDISMVLTEGSSFGITTS